MAHWNAETPLPLLLLFLIMHVSFLVNSSPASCFSRTPGKAENRQTIPAGGSYQESKKSMKINSFAKNLNLNFAAAAEAARKFRRITRTAKRQIVIHHHPAFSLLPRP
jgi:hypothetical protein